MDEADRVLRLKEAEVLVPGNEAKTVPLQAIQTAQE